MKPRWPFCVVFFCVFFGQAPQEAALRCIARNLFPWVMWHHTADPIGGFLWVSFVAQSYGSDWLLSWRRKPFWILTSNTIAFCFSAKGCQKVVSCADTHYKDLHVLEVYVLVTIILPTDFFLLPFLRFKQRIFFLKMLRFLWLPPSEVLGHFIDHSIWIELNTKCIYFFNCPPSFMLLLYTVNLFLFEPYAAVLQFSLIPIMNSPVRCVIILQG